MDTRAKSIVIDGESLAIFHNEGGALTKCFGVCGKHYAIIRSSGVHSPIKAGELVTLAKRIHESLGWTKRPYRLSSHQLMNMRDEWKYTNKQHHALIKAAIGDMGIAHVASATEHVYYEIPTEYASAYIQHELKKSIHLFHAECSLQYSLWIAEELEIQLKKFKPEASDEYTLQASMEDFCHEIRSPLLIDQLMTLRSLILEQGNLKGKQQQAEIFALEKGIASGRLYLQNLIPHLSMLLERMAKVIESVQDSHPKLKGIKMMAMLASPLMLWQINLSWGARVLLLQLLDQKLHVISAINGHLGLERTNLVFAIRLALAEISPHYSDEKILEHCLNWGTPKQDKEFSAKLREKVLKNYKALGIPSKEHKTKKSNVNKNLITFLP